MRIAVTGGRGELGRSLVPFLLAQGHQVASIDITPPAPSAAPGLTQCVADARDFGQFVAAAQGCDALIHLAAHRSPLFAPDPVVYTENTASSYHALAAAAALGIRRLCLASSINAIGGAFSRKARYDYLPLDESHPTYAEDPYSLSKWALEQQAGAFARRGLGLCIASLRFHMLIESRERAVAVTAGLGDTAVRQLWGYTTFEAANRACLAALQAEYEGHEAFYIVAPRTAAAEPSHDLARAHYPHVALRGVLAGNAGFYDCGKAARLLGWRHDSGEGA